MKMFDMCLEDHNCARILGLIKNLLRILWNILTVVGITFRGHVCECIIYAKYILINIRGSKGK